MNRGERSSDANPGNAELVKTFGHQDWLAFGVRDRIIRYFVNPDTVEGKNLKQISLA